LLAIALWQYYKRWACYIIVTTDILFITKWRRWNETIQVAKYSPWQNKTPVINFIKLFTSLMLVQNRTVFANGIFANVYIKVCINIVGTLSAPLSLWQNKNKQSIL